MKKQKNKTDTMADAHRKIAVTKDGPYIVSGRIPLAEQIITNDKDGFSCEWREGVKYPLLCKILAVPLRAVKNPAILRWDTYTYRF